MLAKNIENRNQVEFVSLEQMVSQDHLLRLINAAIDFNKVYEFEKIGHLEMKTEKSLSGKGEGFLRPIIFLGSCFSFSNEKACLGVIAKTDFFYRLSRPQNLQAAAFCVPRAAFPRARHYFS